MKLLRFFCCVYCQLLLTVTLSYGQQRKIVLVPVASFVNEKIKYDYAFSVTRIQFNRAATGFSVGGLSQFLLSDLTRLSTGIIYSQTGGNNLLTTNVTTSSTGANPITFLYRELRRTVQIPLFIDYFPLQETKFMPCFSAGVFYSHHLKVPKYFFFVPSEKIPVHIFFSAGLMYQSRSRNVILVQPYINYDLFKSRYFSNHTVRQLGVIVRITNPL